MLIGFNSMNMKLRVGSLEVSQRKSPATPRTARQLKTSGSDADSVSSLNKATRTPKSSPKVTDRKSPRSPVSEVCNLVLTFDFSRKNFRLFNANVSL